MQLKSKSLLLSFLAFVNLVNPVRGREFWGPQGQDPLFAVKEQSSVIKGQNLPATWLLRPDAVLDRDISDFFKTVPSNQEIGLFLEVTPIWAAEAEIDYHQGILWHYANGIFLSGYDPEERIKLINSAFKIFKAKYGFYPLSVGAWHIDAFSLEYMIRHYGVTTALICSDQFSTDGYQIWGGWWGVPYYPSKFNVLIPAQTANDKLNAVVLFWANRDPLFGYGPGTSSLYSVQANDYLKLGLKTDYFSKLTDAYLFPRKGDFGQIVVGLENDYQWDSFGPEYKRQIGALLTKPVKFLTMAEFGKWYTDRYKGVSPDHEVEMTSGDEKGIWLMSKNERVGLLEKNGVTTIRDWRVYHGEWPEPYLATANINNNLNLSLPAKIDSVRFPEQAKNLDRELLEREKIRLPFFTSPLVYVLSALIFLIFIFFSWRLNRWLALLIAAGVFSQGVTLFKSGLLYRFGMGFWGPNGHDGIWHLALINQLGRKLIPDNPVFAGEKIKNYHYLLDLLIAWANRLTGISTINLYFQIFPLLLTGGLGLLTYFLVKRLTKNDFSSLLAVVFVYFGGSFGWVVEFLRSRTLGGESLFWSTQSASLLINPPFALSVLMILGGLFLCLRYIGEKKSSYFILAALLFGLTISAKAYGGVLVLLSLAAGGVWEWLLHKESFPLRLFMATLTISLLVYLPTNRFGANLFVLSPLWFSHTMLSFQDRLGWIKLEQARQAYFASGRWLRWILAEGLALTIFLVGNLGLRALAVFNVKSVIKGKKTSWLTVSIITFFFASLAIPMLVVQKGNPWNSIQFFYYFVFFSGIITAIWIGKVVSRTTRAIKAIVFTSVLLFNLLTTIGTLKHYLPARPPARLSFDELEGLEFLRSQSSGIVLTYPFMNEYRDQYKAPKPLFTYETTAYVSTFSGKQTFLEDEMNLGIMGVDWQPRRQEVDEFFKTKDEGWARSFLVQNKIGYLYLIGGQRLEVGDSQIGLTKIFENGEVKIFKVSDKI